MDLRAELSEYSVEEFEMDDGGSESHAAENDPREYCQLVRRLKRKMCWGIASTGRGVHTALTDTESDSDTCLLRWSLERCQ